MNAQTPANGIVVLRDNKGFKHYKVTCECSSDGHQHDVFVESDKYDDVIVTIYSKQTTSFQKRFAVTYQENSVLLFFKEFFNNLFSKIRLTKDIWCKGYIEYESDIILNQQQALNYSTALKNAVKDLERVKNDRKKTS